jgi:hypothetical protein
VGLMRGSGSGRAPRWPPPATLSPGCFRGPAAPPKRGKCCVPTDKISRCVRGRRVRRRFTARRRRRMPRGPHRPCRYPPAPPPPTHLTTIISRPFSRRHHGRRPRGQPGVAVVVAAAHAAGASVQGKDGCRGRRRGGWGGWQEGWEWRQIRHVGGGHSTHPARPPPARDPSP